MTSPATRKSPQMPSADDTIPPGTEHGQRATMFIEWCALSDFGLDGWPQGSHAQLAAHMEESCRQGMLRAAELVKVIGKDWRDFGMPENGAAADYLERAIRAEAGEPGDQK